MTAILLAALALGHELPDDVVQCGMQVVVRDEVIELRYQLGMNAATARETLRAWSISFDSAAPVFPLLREAAFARLPNRIHTRVDGLPIELTPIRVKEVRRHHARIECVYQFPNPSAASGAHEIAIRDDNFRHSPGLREVAVKAADGLSITTDAPPVLGRSDLENQPNQQIGPRQLSLVVGADKPVGRWPSLLTISCLVLCGVRGAALARSSGEQ